MSGGRALYCPRKDRRGVHCAHFTGRSVTDGIGQEGTAEVRCCWCDTSTNIGWSAKTVTPKGHGKGAAFRQDQYDWPSHWRASSKGAEES